jgi:hypothetical protein
MNEPFCNTCSKLVTNKWAVIGGKHVGCPKAKDSNE